MAFPGDPSSSSSSSLHYWSQWQVFVCAAIIISPAIAAMALLLHCKRQKPLLAVDLWTPCWKKLHPAWLLGYRAAVLLPMSFLLSQMLLFRGAAAFFFYTQWTFALVILYFAIATVISAHGCWTYSNKNAIDNEVADGLLEGINKNIGGDHEQSENGKIAGFWGYAMQVIYQTCAGAVMLTDVVFWLVLVPFLKSNHFTVNAIMGCMHSLNAVFLLIDTALNNLSFPLFRMAYFVLWSCTYVIFQWILHACGFPWWPYPFLELGTPWAALWYFSMALVHIPCYGAYFLIVKAKDSFLPKLLPNSYRRSG